MDNIRPEGTEDQSVTSTSREALGRNIHARRSKRIKKYPQRYETGFGDFRVRKSEDVTSIVYIVQYGYLNRNVNMDDILLLMAEWYAKECMDAPSTFHMREYYVIKPQIYDPDTPTYMEALPVEHVAEYNRDTDD